MADITKTQNHNMDMNVLRTRLEDLAKEMTDKFGIKAKWEGDSCVLSGPAIKSGSLKLSANTVSIELTLGLMAKMLKGTIEKEIDSRFTKILA